MKLSQILEARYGTAITPKRVEEVYKLYNELEDRMEGWDDPRMFVKILGDMAKGDRKTIEKHLYDDVSEPTINPDLDWEDGYLTAKLSCRWTFNAPEPMNEEKERQRLNHYALGMNLPFTDVYVDTSWEDFGKEKIQFSEAKLIFKATVKGK